MEELHINGDVNENQTLPEVTSCQAKDSIVNENCDAFNSESGSGPQNTTADSKVTVEKENEEEINHGGNDLGDGKKSVYVIRSRNSIEEYSNNIQSTEKGEGPSSPKRFKLVIRSRSTDETVDFERTENNVDKTIEEERSHEDMTQAIAAQATEIVRSVLQRLGNEVETTNNAHQIDQEKTKEKVELSATAISERTALQENKQGEENKVSVAYTDGDDKSSGENLHMTDDDAVTTENVSCDVNETTQGHDNRKIATEDIGVKHPKQNEGREDSITLSTENVQENGEREVLVTKFENEEQHAVSETTIQEFPSDGMPFDGQKIQEGSEENEDSRSKAMVMEIGKLEEKSNDMISLEAEKTWVSSLPEEDENEKSGFKSDEIKLETTPLEEDNFGEERLDFETTELAQSGEVSCNINAVPNQLIGHEEVMSTNFESRKEEIDEAKIPTEEEICTASAIEHKTEESKPEEKETEVAASITTNCEESNIKETHTEDESQEPSLTEMESMTTKEGKAETMEVNIESKEEQSDDQNVVIDEKPLIVSDETSDDQIAIDLEKPNSIEETLTENDYQKPSLPEVASITSKEGKTETRTIIFESKETVRINERSVIAPNETTNDHITANLEESKAEEETLAENEGQEPSLPEIASTTSNEGKDEAMIVNSGTREDVDIGEIPVIAPDETTNEHIADNLEESNAEEETLAENECQEPVLPEIASTTPKEGKDEAMMINFGTREDVVIGEKPVIVPDETTGDHITVNLEESNAEEETLTENEGQEPSLPEIASTTSKEDKEETMMITFETKEAVVINEKPFIAPDGKTDDHITVNLEESNAEEETLIENDGQEPVLPEMGPMTSKEDTEEIMTINFESKKEHSDEQNVIIDEKPVIVPNETTDGQFKKESEILSMKFEAKEDTADKEQLAFAEAIVGELDNNEAAAHTVAGITESMPQEIRQADCEEVEEAANKESTKADLTIVSSSVTEIVPSIAIEEQEEPSSPRQEYVAENVRHDTQSLSEVQEGSEDNLSECNKPQEKPIVKIRLAEEPLGAPIMSENRYDNDIIELDNQVLETPEEVALGNFKDESDSDGEVDVSVEELSQENEQLIKEGGSEEESTPDDWMAKDDSDEIVFKGKAALAIDVEDISLDQVEQRSKNTSQMSDQQENTDDETIVAETKAVTICSGIEGMFPTGEDVKVQTKETARVLPAPEYDIDKEIEEEAQRLINKNKVKINYSSRTVMEEILPSQKIKEEKTELSILLIDEQNQELEEEKPPSPVEAKKVTEEGITEIFETEELRRSGIFDDTLVEEDEEGIQLQSKISQKDVVLANEEYFEAKQKEKHASLRWSLLEKWEEMNNRQSLEIKESETKPPIAPSEIIEEEKKRHRSAEFEISEKNIPVVPEGLQIEPTTLATTKVKTTVTTTTVMKEHSEVQPQTVQKNEQVVVQVENPKDIKIQTTQQLPLHSERETELASKDMLQCSQELVEEEGTQDDSAESWHVQACNAIHEDTMQATSEEEKPPLHDKTQSESPEHAIPMSTILFRMDGTPVIIPPVEQQEPNLENKEKKEDKLIQTPTQTEETELKPMSTILFRMDGSPIVLPAAPEKVSPKIKTVNFSTETQVRPLSVSSVESMRGDREGIPPLAGGEESDIDDSSLHIASQPHSATSRVPSVSPVKEDTSPVGHVNEDTPLVSPVQGESSPPSPSPSHDGDDKTQEVDIPLLDQSQSVGEKGQSCCVIF